MKSIDQSNHDHAPEPVTQLLKSLFPDLTIQRIITGSDFLLEGRICASTAPCPRCQSMSDRVRYYTRTPQDLPLVGVSVRLQLEVRRFRCMNAGCPAVTFAEQIPNFLSKRAQRTVRLVETMTQLGLVLGGEAGARQSQRQGMPVSPASVLPFVRCHALPERVNPRVLGVDDFALRKGLVYGTLLVDGETHHPVDLLPERTANTFREWLQVHPGAEIITRDRSREYARGASEGAPDAVQVADRWHLLANLREAVERLLDRLRPQLKAQSPRQLTGITPYDRDTRRGTLDQSRREASRLRRYTLYTQVKALHKQGMAIIKIAQQLQIARQTVRRYIASEIFPEIPGQARRKSLLDPYAVYLQQRWDEDCHNTKQLWNEIKQQGFRGSMRAVVQWTMLRRDPAADRHSGEGRRPAREVVPLIPAHAAGKTQLPAARQLVWLLLQLPNKLSTAAKFKCDELLRAPEIRTAYPLIQTFFAMIRDRRAQDLVDWIALVRSSAIPELVTFAAGIQQDFAIVHAAASSPYSNGLTEGHVNRLKLIKRSMYGRANLDLLRIRVLARL
jgi:transposase